MSNAEIEKKDNNKTMKTNSSNFNLFKILLWIAVIIIIGWISWQSINFLNSISTEGNPSIHYYEVNETIAASHQISHLTVQEFTAFPQLKDLALDPKSGIFSANGYKYLGLTKISDQQKKSLTKKYGSEDYKGYLEYQGKYYLFEITVS
jgi:hypothetical protein